ncbi:MAG: DUF3822 family protein [Ferruginibacter sp.]
MKTAFHLIPADNRLSSLHLLIELGWYGVSFAWYARDPCSLEGVFAYNFSEGVTDQGIAEDLQIIFKKEPILSKSLTSVSVFYNFKESLLIPLKYYNDTAKSHQLNLIYHLAIKSVVNTDTINFVTGTDKIYNVYRIPAIVHDSIVAQFPGAEFMHSTSAQIQSKVSVYELHCIIYHNTIKVLLFNTQQICFVQQFNYHTPEDIIYYLLNTCDKYKVNVKEVQLILSGMIDEDSNLYQELYKYFLNIIFRELDDDVLVAKSIQEFPGHFFSPLMQLARCAL